MKATCVLIGALFAGTMVSAAQETPGQGVEAGAVQNAPIDATVRVALMDALQARDYAQAEKLLLKAIDQNPKAASLLTLAGSIFFLDGQYMNSAIAIKKAEKLAPLDNGCRFTLAMSYIRLNH